MPTDRPESLIRRIFERAFNQGMFMIIDELVAPGGLTHSITWGLPNNREGLKLLIAMLRTAFPDLHCTIEDEISEDNKVAAYWTMRGTHQGPLLGNWPTNRQITIQGMIFARTENDQIAEGRVLVDQMSIFQQLGIVPPPQRS